MLCDNHAFTESNSGLKARLHCHRSQLFLLHAALCVAEPLFHLPRYPGESGEHIAVLHCDNAIYLGYKPPPHLDLCVDIFY